MAKLKATEWAALAVQRPKAPPPFEETVFVNDNGYCQILPKGWLAPDQALALGQWLVETFGDITP